MWVFAGSLLLMSNEKDKVQSQYILSKDKWNRFCQYVKDRPRIRVSELARCYRDYGCTNHLFWPSIISICKEVSESLNLKNDEE